MLVALNKDLAARVHIHYVRYNSSLSIKVPVREKLLRIRLHGVVYFFDGSGLPLGPHFRGVLDGANHAVPDREAPRPMFLYFFSNSALERILF